MLQNSHFVAFLSSESVGDVDHDAAHRRSNLRYCSSVIVRFTALTPLQRSRSHPIVVQIAEALRSTAYGEFYLFNACYKDSKAQSESQTGSAGTTNQAAKTDPAVCMQTFAQQQQACQSRKLPPPAPGQPSAPDTCLQDAMTAQNRCLANSR
jgi:hypothetical protein